MDAREELVKYVFNPESELSEDLVVLVAANKQDLAGAMSADEVMKVLDLGRVIGKRKCKFLGTSGLSGEGVLEALDWIVGNVKDSEK